MIVDRLLAVTTTPTTRSSKRNAARANQSCCLRCKRQRKNGSSMHASLSVREPQRGRRGRGSGSCFRVLSKSWEREKRESEFLFFVARLHSFSFLRIRFLFLDALAAPVLEEARLDAPGIVESA